MTTRLPWGLKLAELTESSCVIGTPTALPVSASQTRAVLSHDAVTTRLPSGLKLAEVTHLSCVIGTPMALPVSASQTRAVLSPDAVTTRLPSEVKLAEVTSALWSTKIERKVFASAALAIIVAAPGWAGCSKDPFAASTASRRL